MTGWASKKSGQRPPNVHWHPYLSKVFWSLVLEETEVCPTHHQWRGGGEKAEGTNNGDTATGKTEKCHEETEH